MNETDNIPDDWVLVEAAKRCKWPYDGGIDELRSHYEAQDTKYISRPYRAYAALCDMIAKHEQPPVDPDVEAVKRIIVAWAPTVNPARLETAWREEFARAVAQYKQERGQ